MSNDPGVIDPPEASDLLAGIDLLRRRAGLQRPVDALIATGMTEATSYRRLSSPTSLSFGELGAMAQYFSVPFSVLIGGEMAVMRWLVNRAGPPEGGPGPGVYAPWDSNPEPAGSVSEFPLFVIPGEMYEDELPLAA